MAVHQSIPINQIHVPYSFVYNTATERNAATGLSVSDRGKLARQLDDNSLWMLISNNPVTWSQVGGAGDSDTLEGHPASYFTNASNLSSGTLPADRFTDTSHGARAGGSLHAAATTSTAGFISSADKTKLDGIAEGATVGVTDHGMLTGVADDDHTQYLNTTRHDTTARHGSSVVDHGSIGGLSDDDHTQYTKADGSRAFSSTISGITPTSDSHLATKGYVDGVAQGISVKISCRVATTAALDATYSTGGKTLTANANGAISIDNKALALNERVLVKDQSGANAKYNGIYYVSAVGTTELPYILTRALDFDGTPTSDTSSGSFVFISEGDFNEDSGWILSTNDPIVLDTTDIIFTQFSGAGQINAGAGLTKTANTLNVVGTTGRIVANADSIDLASGIATAGTYPKVTIDTYGRVTSGENLASGDLPTHEHSAADLTSGTLPALRFDDTAHGARSGGTLHSVATTSTAGFMSATDKSKLDAVGSSQVASVTITDLSVDAETGEYFSHSIGCNVGQCMVLTITETGGDIVEPYNVKFFNTVAHTGIKTYDAENIDPTTNYVDVNGFWLLDDDSNTNIYFYIYNNDPTNTGVFTVTLRYIKIA